MIHISNVYIILESIISAIVILVPCISLLNMTGKKYNPARCSFSYPTALLFMKSSRWMSYHTANNVLPWWYHKMPAVAPISLHLSSMIFHTAKSPASLHNLAIFMIPLKSPDFIFLHSEKPFFWWLSYPSTFKKILLISCPQRSFTLYDQSIISINLLQHTGIQDI